MNNILLKTLDVLTLYQVARCKIEMDDLFEISDSDYNTEDLINNFEEHRDEFFELKRNLEEVIPPWFEFEYNYWGGAIRPQCFEEFG